MLPGFRVLFAIVLLSVSLLVFGLGAAALLRAAHDNFAGLAAPPPASEAVVAREREQRQATLALLQIETQAEPGQRAAPSAEPRPTEPDTAAAAPAQEAPAPGLAEVTATEPGPEAKPGSQTDTRTEMTSEAKPEPGQAPAVVALAPAAPDPVPAGEAAPATTAAIPPAGDPQPAIKDASRDAAEPSAATGENAAPSEAAKPGPTAALDTSENAAVPADLPEEVVKAAARPRPEIPRHLARRHKKPKVHHVRAAVRARPAAQQTSPFQQQRQQINPFPGFGG